MKTIILLANLICFIVIANKPNGAGPAHNAKKQAAVIQSAAVNSMKPKISIVTIGAKNFGKMLAFYKDSLGWATKADANSKIAFFNLSGLVFAVCDLQVLNGDAQLHLNAATPCHITLAQNLASEQEVINAFEVVKKAGATIVKAPQKASWGGFSGYFADPEGNLWEIAYNPFFAFDKDGNIILP
jgi:uncharacterized glyoxalase superfamily protein PhnB